MIDLQLGKDRDTVDPLVSFAAWTSLDPDKVAQLEEPLLGIGIAWLTPRGKHRRGTPFGIDERTLATDERKAPQEFGVRMRIIFERLADLRLLAGGIA